MKVITTTEDLEEVLEVLEVQEAQEDPAGDQEEAQEVITEDLEEDITEDPEEAIMEDLVALEDHADDLSHLNASFCAKRFSD